MIYIVTVMPAAAVVIDMPVFLPHDAVAVFPE